MMHYHGTPITPMAQLERMAGRLFCVSYARPDDLARCLRIAQGLIRQLHLLRLAGLLRMG